MEDDIGSMSLGQFFEAIVKCRIDDRQGDAVQVDTEAGEAWPMLPEARDDGLGRIASGAREGAEASDEDRATGSVGAHLPIVVAGGETSMAPRWAGLSLFA